MTENPIKMLSIDDSSITTTLDRAGYREMGVQVFCADKFEKAISMIADKKIEIIVINLDYYGEGAPGLCKFVRGHEHYSDIPIVVTSVQSSGPYKNAVMDAGASLFVEQPIPRTYFIEQMKQLLTKATRGEGRVSLDEDNPVKATFGSESFQAPVGDLSRSGMLLCLDDSPHKEGSVCTLSFTIPGVSKPLEIEGEVVRVLKVDPKYPRRKTGLGIQFTTFKGDSKKKLLSFLDDNDQKEVDNRLLYYL